MSKLTPEEKVELQRKRSREWRSRNSDQVNETARYRSIKKRMADGQYREGSELVGVSSIKGLKPLRTICWPDIQSCPVEKMNKLMTSATYIECVRDVHIPEGETDGIFLHAQPNLCNTPRP